VSFILDALRKSENERRQGDTPGIAATRYRVDQRRRNVWLPLVSAILLINAALMAFLLLRPSGNGSEPAPVALPPEPIKPPPMASAARPAPKVRPLSREVAPPDDRPAPVTGLSQPTATSPAVPDKMTAADVPGIPTASKTSMAGAESLALPSLQQLVLNGEIEMPPLRIDMHVYSPEPSQRFVFINMSKYREGERLKEGPQVESIDSAGVILSHQGRRFTLARE
jgi:general secretion pathway protein B